MIKIDLHTHSIGSPDGSLNLQDYKHAIEQGNLDYIAITDHDNIEIAQQIQKQLGDHIIVGQEVTCKEGEIVGLFLNKKIEQKQNVWNAVKQIKEQGGIVYLPHPFETVRKGLPKSVADQIAQYIDIVEVHNGRAFFQNKGPLAMTWAKLNRKAIAASSDAHGRKGIGRVHTVVQQPPTKENIVQQLTNGRLNAVSPPLSSLLYPKLNRLRGKIRRKK